MIRKYTTKTPHNLIVNSKTNPHNNYETKPVLKKISDENHHQSSHYPPSIINHKKSENNRHSPLKDIINQSIRK